MKHRHPVAAAVVLLLCLLLNLPRAYASVELVYFRAAAQTDNTILVTWQTATERDTTGFRLFRSDSAQPTDWGNPIAEQPAQGNAIGGADYQYVDRDVTAGQRYYYLLKEISSSGTSDHGPVNAGIGIATDTPTLTPTATSTTAASATPTATRTQVGTAGAPTLTRPAPTATRRFTETPVIAAPVATATRGGATAAPLRTATATRLAGAQVATPTGLPLRATAPAAIQPSATPSTPSPLPSPTLSPTLEVATVQSVAQIDTATPRPTKEVTPVIFAAETAGQRSTPQAAEAVGSQGSRDSSLALIVGGSAIGVAALLAAVLLFMRSRRP